MSRLKYSMSDAFLKKFLRLERGERKNVRRGGGEGDLAGGRGPHHPTLAPGYLRNCSWKRSRWPCSVSAGRPAVMGGTAVTDPGLQIYSHAPGSIQLQKPAGEGQMGAGCEGSGREWGVLIPGIGTRDASQGEVGVGTPKYPCKASGAAPAQQSCAGAGGPRHIGLNSSRTCPSNSFIWDVYVGWSGSLEPSWDTGTW